MIKVLLTSSAIILTSEGTAVCAGAAACGAVNGVVPGAAPAGGGVGEASGAGGCAAVAWARMTTTAREAPVTSANAATARTQMVDTPSG